MALAKVLVLAPCAHSKDFCFSCYFYLNSTQVLHSSQGVLLDAWISSFRIQLRSAAKARHQKLPVKCVDVVPQLMLLQYMPYTTQANIQRLFKQSLYQPSRTSATA